MKSHLYIIEITITIEQIFLVAINITRIKNHPSSQHPWTIRNTAATPFSSPGPGYAERYLCQASACAERRRWSSHAPAGSWGATWPATCQKKHLAICKKNTPWLIGTWIFQLKKLEHTPLSITIFFC